MTKISSTVAFLAVSTAEIPIIENALAAIAVAKLMGVATADIVEVLHGLDDLV